MIRAAIFSPLTALLFILAMPSVARAEELVPIALHDGLVWADVRCGSSLLHFVVDTGSEKSCINFAAARRLGIRLGQALNVAGVGGETPGYFCTAFRASIGEMALPDNVVALDLSGPARGCHEPIDGLIGADFFRGKVIRIDCAQGILSTEAPLAGQGSIPLRFNNGVICAPVSVNGGPARWTRLDTGCTEALLWCKGVGNCSRGAGSSIALAWLTGRSMHAEVSVGQVRIHDLGVKFRLEEIFPGEAGLLGNGALSRYRVTIDGIRHRLRLEPGA